MSVNERPATRLWREALVQFEVLLQEPPQQRERMLADISQTHPQLHSMLLSLLDAEALAANSGFLDPPRRNDNALGPGVLLGPYRIRSHIGSGGMGEVWLASRDDGLYEGEVAIKTLLHPYLGGGVLRDRFLREAQILGRLTHPNIARLLDAGVSVDGGVYLVIEYVRGAELDSWCDEHKLGVDERLKLFLDVCAAVAQAHANLVVHRDIKPSNILVTESGQVKLLDFGVAKLLEAEPGTGHAELTRLSGRIFTPEYAAPEQVLGEQITTATDVYSLCVLLHVLMTGKRPFADVNPVAVERAVLHDDPVRASLAVAREAEAAAARSTTPARLRRDLEGDLDNIIARGLRKAPEERYASVAALAEDIRRHLAYEPILARPESLAVRTRKFVRRNRLAVGAAAAVVLALGIGLAASLWQLQVARTERRHAEEVKEFIASIFRSSDPFVAGHKSMTAVDLLSLARERIDSELAAQPQNAVELLQLVAESQINLGQVPAGKVTYARTLELAKGLHPRDDVRIAMAQTGLAQVARVEGDFAKSRELVDAALPILRANQPRTARHLSELLFALAFLQSEEGDPEGAIASAREGVAAVTAAFGPRHVETIWSKATLIQFLVSARRFDEARPMAEEALRDAQAMFPNKRNSLLVLVEAQYGRLLVQSGDLAPGVEHLKAGVAIATELHGPDASVASMLSTLMTAQVRLGDMEGTIATAKQSSELGQEGLYQARIMTNLGRYTLLAGKVEESLEPLRRAVELCNEHDQGKGSWLPLAQGGYGSALTLSGRIAEAERLLEEALPAARDRSTSGGVAAVLNGIGLTRQVQSQWAKSELAFREALENTSPKDPNQKMRADALLGIGVAKLELGEWTDAEQWLRQAEQSASSYFLNFVPVRADIAMNLGRALLAQNKTEEARAALTNADTYWQHYDAANRNAGLASYWMAQGHLAAGANEDALDCLTRSIETLKSSPLPGDARLVADARRSASRLQKQR